MAGQILIGDAKASLLTLEDGLAQACITSPPYFGLRDYGVEGQIGLEKTLDAYIDSLVEVFREVRRVLRDDGTLWLNLGDSYASASRGAKQKDLMMVPFRVALALQADGWYLRSVIPWLKGSCMPESTRDRPTNAVEYWFLFAKSKSYYMDMDAIKKEASGRVPGNKRHQKGAGLPGFEIRGGLLAAQQKPQTTRNRRNTDWFFDSIQIQRDYANEILKSKGMGPIFEGDELAATYVNPKAFKEAHFATFPPDLVEPMVRASTSEKGGCPDCGAPLSRVTGREAKPPKVDGSDIDRFGTGDHGVHRKVGQKYQDWLEKNPKKTLAWEPTCKHSFASAKPQTVIDPFFGAGTTGLVAARLGRKFIGVELNSEYAEMAAERIRKDNGGKPKKKRIAYLNTKTGFAIRGKQVGERVNGSAVYLGDSFDLLKKVEPESVSLVLTDPPYNVSQRNNLDTMGRKGIEFDWDGDFDQERWLEAAVAALRPGGSFVVWNDWKNLGQIAKLLESHGMAIKRDLVWRKSNPMPRNTKRLPVQAREYALWAIKPATKSKGGWTFNFAKGPGAAYHRGEWTYPVQRAINPTKKPTGLFREIIELFSNPGDLVLDPFVGCGTTAVAASLAGRRYLCFEQNKDFYADALRRLSEIAVTP